MPFDRRNYPNSMKKLDKEVRDKAIDIVNAMLEEGYDEDNAIPIAISQAKDWANNASKAELKEIRKKDLKDHEKSSGNLEEYIPEKIARSIKNAADRNDKQLNSSDVKILIKDVEKSMKEMNRKVFRTDEIKEYVKNALVSEGYSQIYDSYVSYVQAQN